MCVCVYNKISDVIWSIKFSKLISNPNPNSNYMVFKPILPLIISSSNNSSSTLIHLKTYDFNFQVQHPTLAPTSTSNSDSDLRHWHRTSTLAPTLAPTSTTSIPTSNFDIASNFDFSSNFDFDGDLRHCQWSLFFSFFLTYYDCLEFLWVNSKIDKNIK